MINNPGAIPCPPGGCQASAVMATPFRSQCRSFVSFTDSVGGTQHTGTQRWRRGRTVLFSYTQRSWPGRATQGILPGDRVAAVWSVGANVCMVSRLAVFGPGSLWVG